MSKRCMGCMEQYNDDFSVCPHCGYIDGTLAEETIHMNPGTLLHNRYIIGKVLGFGGFGVTYIGWDGKLEQKVAIKEYLPSEFSTRMPGQSTVTIFNGEKSEQFKEGLNKFVDEARRLAKFQNEPGIVKIFDSFTENETAYIVMEFLDGETLTEKLKRDGIIAEDDAINMLSQIMKSLQVVHEEGILHRDIAPDNIFITKNGDVKLIDFGASRYATTSFSRSLTVIIKPGYSPEEQYRSRGDQGPHTDVYALAAVMYKMLTGITPPDALDRRTSIETKRKDLLKDLNRVNSNVSPNVENAVLNAMNVRIDDRTASVVDFIKELNSEPPAKRRYGKIKKIDIYSWPLWLKISFVSILSIIIVFGTLIFTGVIDFPSLFSDNVSVPAGMVVVPDVEGMDKDEALEKLNEIGLTPSPDGNIESEYVEIGKIVLQTPQGGIFLSKNEKVSLFVSSGIGVVEAVDGVATVPYVVWDTKEDAIAKLLKAGLSEPTIETKYDNNVAEGKVISQSVASGTKLETGTQITIIVSKGAKNSATNSSSGNSNIDTPTSSTDNKITTSDETFSSQKQNYYLKLSSKNIIINQDHTEYITIDTNFPDDALPVLDLMNIQPDTSRGAVVTLKDVTLKSIKLYAESAGKAEFKITVNYAGESCSVLFSVEVVEISMNPYVSPNENLNVILGQTKKWGVDTDLTGYTVSYSIEDSSIATINSNGEISGKKLGETRAHITIKYKSLTVEEIVKVKIALPTLSTSISPESLHLLSGGTWRVATSYWCSLTPIETLTSDNPNVVSVGDNNVLHSHNRGTATITYTATINVMGYIITDSSTCVVTVE